MKNLVILKSFQNGISVYMDENAPFDDIINEVGAKFAESSKFFKDAKMAISFEGRSLSDADERTLIKVISKNSQITVVCIVGKDEAKNGLYLKALRQSEQRDDSFCGQFHKGSLKNGQILQSPRSLIILGDVYPGCSVLSEKDIIILGGLYGEAHAGILGGDEHFIIAMEMNPEKLKVSDFRMKTMEKTPKWSIKAKVSPKIAFIREQKVIIESLEKEVLTKILEF